VLTFELPRIQIIRETSKHVEVTVSLPKREKHFDTALAMVHFLFLFARTKVRLLAM
jgi:hypothetical protein